jgi:hypothetical protein
MYSTFAKCTDLPEFLQITGRLCIVCVDGVPLTLHITPEDHDNLLKGYNITEEFVHRAIQQDNSVNVREYVENLNIFKKKLPKRDLTKEVKFKVNTVNTLEEDTRNGGWVTDDKGLYILKKIITVDNEENVSVVTSEGTVLEGVEVVESEDEKEQDGDGTTDDEEIKKIDGVDLNKLRDWFRDDCQLVIAKILKFLYRQSNPVSSEEISDGIRYDGKNIINNIQTARSIKSKNGMMWNSKNNDTEIILNPKIRKYLEKI